VLLVEQIKKSPAAIAFGANPGSFVTDRYVLHPRAHVQRPAPGRDRSDLAARLHLGIVARWTVARRHFQVTGVYHIGVAEQDEGAVIRWPRRRRSRGKIDEATTIAVSLTSTTSRRCRPADAQSTASRACWSSVTGVPALRAGVTASCSPTSRWCLR